MTLLTKDPVWRDSRNAAYLFAAGAALLLIGAGLGLHQWPAEPIFKAAVAGTGKALFLAYHGYAWVLVTLFWASRPGRAAQWSALLLWPLVSLVIGVALRDDLPIAWIDGQGIPATMFLVTTLSMPCLALLVWRAISKSPSADPLFEGRLRWLLLLSLLFMMVPAPGLGLTSALHPVTFDLYALLWDRAAGLNFAPALMAWIDAVPGLSGLVVLCYGMTPLAFLAVALKHLRGRPAHVPTALLAWVALTTAALIAYHLFPITGPRYVFGPAGFAKALLDTTAHPVQLVGVQPFPRNGMPSMHFGWMLAASILWWQSSNAWVSRAVILTMAACTAAATLYLGEHYVIDLIVAVPFVLAGLALATTGVSWARNARRGVVLLGFGIWLLWVFLLRTQIQVFVDQPAWCGLLLAVTALVVVAQIRWMRRFRFELASPDTCPPVMELASQDAVLDLRKQFGWLFFASGAAALTYQVLFAKELALVFGSTATATFTVLATFLGGMALGSLLGGTLANRVRRPMVVYAFVEIGIAIYCVLTPTLFEGVQALYVASAGGIAADAGALVALRVVLGAVVLLVPTVLMGATLPLLTQALGASGGRVGQRVAWLYFANTAGAALGALLTAYFIIPALGGHRTTLVAAMLNLLVALGAIELAKRVAGVPADESTAPDHPAGGKSLHFTPIMQTLALITLGVGGLLSLGLEVVYVHMLSIVAGNSVYAFGLMVATFLLGLSIGGELARRWLTRSGNDPIVGLSVSFLGLASMVALGAGGWNAIPEYFASYAGYPLAKTFVTREAIRGLVCALIMVPPTLFIGAAYVFGMDVATSGVGRAKTLLLGRAAAVNTGGNILGVLLFGFVLLPLIGGLAASQWIAIGAFGLGLAAMAAAGRARAGKTAWLLLPAAAALGWGQTWTLDYNVLSSGANVYFLPQNYGQVIDHAESIDGGLTTVAKANTSRGPALTLLTNGKFQGNDSHGGEMQAQIGFAMAPLLHLDQREQALVIGYGTGVTSRVLRDAGFRSLDIAELSADIVRLADRHFASVNDRVSSQSGVHLHLTDGRNLLLLQPKQYDLVSIEITSIWFAGAASLYNREFYQLVRSRLQPEGVLQQWVQLHRLSPTDILSVIATLRSEFKFVSLYVMGGQGILVASNDERKASTQQQAIAKLADEPRLAAMREVLGRPVQALSADRLLDPAGVDRLLAESTPVISAWWSTDNNMLLEYQTPKANVNDPARSHAANLAWLKRYTPAGP